MKHLVSLVLLLVFSFSLSAQEIQDSKAEIKFVEETINYGKIPQGSDGKRVFEFSNVGKSPLIISKIYTSCGCTVPKKPDHPIMPGEKGKIEVSYDTKRIGGFSKIITIISNAKTGRKILKIKGEVEKVSLENDKSILSEGSL